MNGLESIRMSNSALISPDSPDDHNLVAVIDGDISNDLGSPCRPESHALPAISSLISDLNTLGSAIPLVRLTTFQLRSQTVATRPPWLLRVRRTCGPIIMLALSDVNLCQTVQVVVWAIHIENAN